MRMERVYSERIKCRWDVVIYMSTRSGIGSESVGGPAAPSARCRVRLRAPGPPGRRREAGTRIAHLRSDTEDR